MKAHHETPPGNRPRSGEIEHAANGQEYKSNLLTRRKIEWVLLVSLAAILGIALYAQYSFTRSELHSKQERRIIELTGIIRYLDESLTMSACMAAATGDLEWEKRYRSLEPQLDAAIKECVTLMPDPKIKEAVSQTDAANIKLVAMENEAFELVREGKREIALGLLLSSEYRDQKRIYSEGMTRSFIAMEAQAEDYFHKKRWLSWGIFAFVAINVVTLFSLSLAMLQMKKHLVERNEMLNALLVGAERYKTLFESSRDAIMTLRPERGFLTANPATIELFGAEDVEEFISKSPADLSPEYQPDGVSSAAKAQKVMAIAMRDGTHFFEWRHKRIDGSEFDATVLLTRMELAGEAFLQATVRDITEHKKAEELIMQHKEMLETIFQATPYGMILLDEQLTIKMANTVALKVVGRESPAVVDMKCGNGIGCINAEMTPEGCGTSPLCPHCVLRESIEGVFSSGQAVEGAQFQHTFLVDGNEIAPWLEVCIEPLRIDGKPHVIVVIGNITERRLAYEAKSQFLANMSHEIRTPMNAIMGFSDILAGEKLTGDQIEYVNTIRNSGKHLLRVIDDILDFSKIEAGKLEVELTDCSLGEVLAGIESLATFRAKDNHLEFKINASKDLPAQIHTDTARLTQCLINLVNNAIKFTHKGHVYVNVSLEERDKQPYVRFDVEDTGIGIPLEKQKKIFESFTQADESHTRKYGGTGLGLTITRQLAGLLGGELSLTSEEGKGSVFSLVLPAGVDVAKEPALGSLSISGDTDADKGKMERYAFSGHVLVAEDVKTNQMLTELLLKQMGLEVTIASDGKEAVDKALARKFDLILMDIHMPNMNGYEATKSLRAEGITTPIIALTADAMKGDDKKCIEAGCDDYLAKPVSRKELLQKIRKYLASEQQRTTEPADSQANGR